VPKIVNRMTAKYSSESSAKIIHYIEGVDNDGSYSEALGWKQTTKETGQRKSSGRHREYVERTPDVLGLQNLSIVC
jgi:hypothetical protein